MDPALEELASFLVRGDKQETKQGNVRLVVGWYGGMTGYILWVLRGEYTKGMAFNFKLCHHQEEGYYKEQVVQRVRSEH